VIGLRGFCIHNSKLFHGSEDVRCVQHYDTVWSDKGISCSTGTHSSIFRVRSETRQFSQKAMPNPRKLQCGPPLYLRERGRWGDPDGDGRIILRWMFRKLEGVVGTGRS
jgi:hypothetical protein